MTTDKKGNQPVPRINLTDRFRLAADDQVQDWLGQIVAAYPAMAEGVSDEAPVIRADWHARSDGAEWTAERLVRGAVADGIIICPNGMDVHFVHEPNSDGGSYHFAVDIGHDPSTQISIATFGYEMRKLGEPDTVGVEAAASILAEAFTAANSALDKLGRLIASSANHQPGGSSTMASQTDAGSRQPSLATRGLTGSVVVAAWDAHRRGQITHLTDAHGPIAAIVPAHAGLRLNQPVLMRTGLDGLDGLDGQPLTVLGWFLGVHSVSQRSADPDVDVWIGHPAAHPDPGRVYTVRRSQLTGLYQEGA